MRCKSTIDPRKVLQRIIKNMITRNIRTIETQLALLETYDIALWESIARGFIRAVNFAKLGAKMLNDDNFLDETIEYLIGYYRKILNLAMRSKNLTHKSKTLSKMGRAGIFIGYENVPKIFEEAYRAFIDVRDIEEKIKTGSYLLFETGKVISFLRNKRKSEENCNDEILRKIEDVAQKSFKIVISYVELLQDHAKKAKALSYISEGIRELSIIVKENKYETTWLDVHKAEIIASESLKNADLVNSTFLEGIIKTYVAYIYYTLSSDTRSKAETLYDDAIELALKLARENTKRAGELLGEIAFTKALTGDNEEAEILFHEACLLALKCPRPSNILSAIKIAELAGKSRLTRIAAELLEDYIIPAIKSLKESLAQVALLGIVSDVAAWVDLGWGARIALNAAEELWLHSPDDLRKGMEIYLLALAAQKSALPNPDAAWRILNFLISGLKRESWRLPMFLYNISLKWLGRAYVTLMEIPSFFRIFKKELDNYIRALKENVDDELYYKALLEIAEGVGSADKELSISLVDESIKGAVGTSIEAKIYGMAIKVAGLISDNLVESYLSDIVKKAEELGSLEESINYLISILREAIPSNSAVKIAKIIVDMLTDIEARKKISKPILIRFVRILRKINSSWAEEIDAMFMEERRYMGCTEPKNKQNVVCEDKE